MSFIYSWRWFGPKDPVSLDDIRQTGAAAVVTALHQIPAGDAWPLDEIEKRTAMIAGHGLEWIMVESIPVHEDIKKRTGNYRTYIDNWKTTLRRLARSGIRRICYNFMPVLDWSRTDLRIVMPDGTIGTGFESVLFGVFDLFMLNRPGADHDWPDTVVQKARNMYSSMNADTQRTLINTVLLGFPGSLETRPLDQLKRDIAAYDGMNAATLRENLLAFLGEVIPEAQDAGVLLAIHPDDPPWPLLGLPRIVGTAEDLAAITAAIDVAENGITLCTGSLGAGYFNDVAALAKRFASRINFAHLRNVRRTPSGDFTETHHLDGDLDLHGVVRELVYEQRRRTAEGRSDNRIPMRPDHGLLMNLEQGKKDIYPGYSLLGRMRGLAEIRGLASGIEGMP